MVKNFFRIAFRNISQHKVFTFLNVTGLAIGLAASLLILLWVQNEFSYDRFHRNAKNIYRVEEDQFYSGERYHVTVTPQPSGPVWMQKIPEIKEQSRLNGLPRILFRQGDRVFFETSVVAADSGLFKIFTLPLISGDRASLLSSPHSIVLTQKLARKYFGNEDPLGKTLTLENRLQFMVTGVMKDLPKNSVLSFDAVLPYSLLKEIGAFDNSWGDNSIFTYVLLEKDAVTGSVNKKLTDVVLENSPQTTTKFMLFPFLDIHLHTQFGFGENNGPVTVVYIFTLIAVFVLLIACINFINLSTAKASTRGKEVGIKKVSGAGQLDMIIQFMLESLMLVAVALVIALIVAGLFISTFNSIAGKNFSIADLFRWRFITDIIITGTIAGLISGVYPALYLASFKPVTVLKGEAKSGKSGNRFRQVLVVVQFTLSILIAVTAVFMYLQLKFLHTKDLGFNRKNLICIPMTESIKSKYYSLKNELLKETFIQGVTASGHNPVRMGSNSGGARWEGKDPDKQVLIGTNTVDYDYLKTLQMKLVSGRDFSIDYSGDLARDTTGNFLVNEEVVKIMGIGDPVGKHLRFMGLNGTIVGVLKNFHFKGADQSIEPMAFALTRPDYFNVALIRLAGGNLTNEVKRVGEVWSRVIPDYPLDFSFIEQDYDSLYRSQTRLTSLLKYFTILAIIIACLGLYGLSSYSAERRTNEVGIRKVMGAGSLTIIYTLSKEFIFPVIISIILAVPSGWIIVEKLLSQYAYRIDLNLFVFAGISLGAILIALVTVSFQAYKASGTDPAVALKVE